jgi:CARDB protein
MRRFLPAVGLSLLLLLITVDPAGAQTPTPTESVKIQVPTLYFASDGKLKNQTTDPAACAPTVDATSGAPAPVTFTWDTLATNGSYWQYDDIKVGLSFTGAGAQSYRSFGVNVTVEVKGGATPFGKASIVLPPGTDPGGVKVFTIKPKTGNVTVAKDKVSATVTMVSAPPAGGVPSGLPGQTQSVSLQCGSTSSVTQLPIARGQPGDADFDGDGLPDSEDQDIDGDNIPNATEAGLACNINGNQVDFVHSAAQQPGDHDADGYSDQDECSKGSDPLDAGATPPPPKPLPWGLIIGAFLLLLVIAALIFFFTVFGKAAAITVVSASELIVPPGTQGKYQLQVQNLRKKGNPINFQLSTQGLPDGWDAKLQPDHAVLDPAGGAKNAETVWLHVEAPQHTDPESAVVKVKAIALNAAGRKDTLKLPASAATITSINVPPNARVPVKRGAPVKLKSEKEISKEEAMPAPAEGGPSSAAMAASGPAPEEPAKGKKGKKTKAPEPPTEPVAPPPPPAAAPAPGSKPALQVGGLNHSPPSFAAGQDVKSVVTVTNNGADPQTLKLSLFVNDALADAQTVSVKPGKSKEVKFKWTAQERNKLNIRGELVAG